MLSIIFFANIFIRFGSKLYSPTVGIPNCAPIVADLSMFCYNKDFMLPLSDKSHGRLMLVKHSTLLQDIEMAN